MLKGFKRKKEVVKEEQVGSMLWPYTSKVSIPNVEGIEQEINALDQRVLTLENTPSGGEGIGEERVSELINQSLEPVNTSINTNKTNIASNLTKINTNTSKITTIENRLNNLPSGGVGMSEVKNYVDPKFNVLTGKVTNNTNTINSLNEKWVSASPSPTTSDWTKPMKFKGEFYGMSTINKSTIYEVFITFKEVAFSGIVPVSYDGTYTYTAQHLFTPLLDVNELRGGICVRGLVFNHSNTNPYIDLDIYRPWTTPNEDLYLNVNIRPIFPKLLMRRR